MKKHFHTAVAAALVLGSLSVQAQTGTSASTTAVTKKKTTKRAPKKHVETQEERDIRELKEKLAAQQQQIDTLTQQNSAKDAALNTAQQSAASAQTAADEAKSQAQAASQTGQQQGEQINAVKSTVSDLQTANAGLATTISATKTELNEKIESPTALHYKGVTIQPIGYLAFEGVWRERAVNADINTPFNAIPFPSANEGHTSELNFSGRQSRIGALIVAPAEHYTLTGYYEADWLGSGTTSNNNQSNSYVLRQRQIWGQFANKKGFAVSGGQMWSLATEMRKGTDPRSEIQPQAIDAQYVVGYTWARQPELRLQQRWGDYKTSAFTLGMSLEQAQITNFTANGTNPNQYFFGGLGQNGGLYNAAASAAGSPSCTASSATPPVVTCTETTSNITTYANNVAPDVIVKAAYDLPLLHFEVGGIARFLRDQYFPVTWGGTPAAPTFAYNTNYVKHTSTAGGVMGAIRGYIGTPGTFPAVEVGVQAMAGTGVGRYGSSQLADATLRPDESLEPVKNYHGLFSLEWHATPKFDVQAHYGGEYAQRTVYTTPVGSLVGYGTPNTNDAGCYNLPAAPSTTSIGNGGSTGSLSATTCGSPTKYIQEGFIGLTYRPVSSAKYGKLQYAVNYQIVNRQLWSGLGSASTPTSPRAQDSMVLVQMRYYIP